MWNAKQVCNYLILVFSFKFLVMPTDIKYSNAFKPYRRPSGLFLDSIPNGDFALFPRSCHPEYSLWPSCPPRAWIIGERTQTHLFEKVDKHCRTPLLLLEIITLNCDVISVKGIMSKTLHRLSRVGLWEPPEELCLTS